MGAYVYQDKILHINRYRRNGDGAPYESGPKEVGNDRRRKLRDGIMLIDFDRRQNQDLEYSGPERRGGIERRSGFDRRISTDRRIGMNRRINAY
jgi:hypothetical protein